MVPAAAVPSAFHVHRGSSTFINPVNHTPRDAVHVRADIIVHSTRNNHKHRKTKPLYSAMPDLASPVLPPVVKTSRRSQFARPRPRSAGWGSKKEGEIHRRSQGDESRDTEELAKFFSTTPPPWDDQDATIGGRKLNRSRSRMSKAAMNLFKAGGPLTFRRGDHPRQWQHQANEMSDDVPGNHFFVQKTAKNSGKKYREVVVEVQGKTDRKTDRMETRPTGFGVADSGDVERDGDVIVLPSDTSISKGSKKADSSLDRAKWQRDGLGILQSHPDLVDHGRSEEDEVQAIEGRGVHRSSSGTNTTNAAPGSASAAKSLPKHRSRSRAFSSNETAPQRTPIPKSTVAAAIAALNGKDTRTEACHDGPSVDPATSSSSPVNATHANFKLTTLTPHSNEPKATAAAAHGFPSQNGASILPSRTSASDKPAAIRQPDTPLANASSSDLTSPSQTPDRPLVNHLAALALNQLPPRTSSRKTIHSVNRSILATTPSDLNHPHRTPDLPSKSRSLSERAARDHLTPSPPNRGAIPDGLSLRSSMQSGTESVTGDVHSDASSAVVMDADEKKLYQRRIKGGPQNDTSNPPKPGPAPTRGLPSLPEGYDKIRVTNKSERATPSGDGGPTNPSPRSPMREVVINTDPTGRPAPANIDTTSEAVQYFPKVSADPTSATSATSGRSMLSAASQPRRANGPRAEKVRALKARDLSSIRARYENKKLEESQALEEAAKEGEKLITDPSIEMPKSAHSSPVLIERAFGQKSAPRRISSNSTVSNSYNRSSSRRRHNAISPIFLVMEQEPTTGKYRTGGLSPRLPVLHRERSVRSHVTSNGTHTPPRSASPSLPSSDDEGYGTQGVPKSAKHNKVEPSTTNTILQQRLQNHPATPVTPVLNLDNRSSTGTDTDLAFRVAALERKNRFLEEALISVIHIAGSTNSGPGQVTNPSPLSSAGAARRPESGLSAVSLGSMSTSGGDRALEAIISFLQGQREAG
jgi:hypothetical protein